MTGLSLRRLVENPQVLAEGIPSGNDHPLAVGIKKRREYDHPLGKFALPTRGPAHEALVLARTRIKPPVAEYLREAAFAALIGAPGYAIPLKGLPVEAKPSDADPSNRMRRVALLSILQSPTNRDAANPGLRLGAGAVLTVELGANKGLSESAQLEVVWNTSTAGLLAWLAAIEEQAWGSTFTHPKNAVTLLIHPHCGSAYAEIDAQTRRTARLLGLSLQVVNRGRLDGRSVRTKLGQGGSVLAAIGPADDETIALASAFEAGGRGRTVHFFELAGARQVQDEVQDVLLVLAGVTASLHPLADPARRSDEATRRRPPIPITDPSDCQHHDSRVYVYDAMTKLWWTRDTDQHGGSIFKTYKKRDGVLLHDADRDVDGGVIVGKHKGPSGISIPLIECHPCTKPASKHIA